MMKSPKCSLPSSLDTMKKNLLRIFPLVDKKFRLHFIRGKKEVVADDYDHQVMSELCCVITIGKAFKPLANFVPKIDGHPELIDCRECVQLPVKMADKYGKEHEYLLEIEHITPPKVERLLRQTSLTILFLFMQIRKWRSLISCRKSVRIR